MDRSDLVSPPTGSKKPSDSEASCGGGGEGREGRDDVGEAGGGGDVGGCGEDRKELKLAMFHVSLFPSAGALFTLLSFLVPGASRRFQIQCWQTAIVSFVSAVDVVRRHPVVWSVLRESGEPSKKI